jgi:thioredoxin-related protein
VAGSHENAGPIAVQDFAAVAAEVRARGLPLLLMVTSQDCPYCYRLESEYLRPMWISGEYEGVTVLLRKLEVDHLREVRDFNGAVISVKDFQRRYKAFLTPTLLFLNARGEQISERILGYNTPELFGDYIYRGIDEARARL